MSTTTTTTTTTTTSTDESRPVAECRLAGCESVGRPWDFQAGCCSVAHRERHIGHRALAALKYDHTRCFSCFAELKEIEDPPENGFLEVGAGWTFNPDEDRFELETYSQEHTRRAACGFQTRTPQATVDQRAKGHLLVTGTICDACGVTDHREHIGYLPAESAHQLAGHIMAWLVSAIEDGDLPDIRGVDADAAPDPETLHQVYRGTEDLERAAGAALLAES